MSEQEYTRWSAIAAGEGGGRIATKYFTRNETPEDNPGLRDRVLLLNTNRTDMTNALDTIESVLEEPEDASRYATTFGPLSGVGNDFEKGEMCADEGFGRVANRVDDSGIDVADAFVYLTTLGGGTGNGTVPYLVHRLKTDPPTAALDQPNFAHITFAAWPYSRDGAQQHFNAVCGLSRLLKWYDGSQNADMVLLASNSRVAEIFDDDETEDPNEVVNQWIRRAVDFMIDAGRDATRVIDTQDYIGQPSRIEEYHFSPGIATNCNSIYELELMFDEAAEQTFVPIDPATSKAVYAIVRAPRSEIERGDYQQHHLSTKVADWLEEIGCDDVRHRNETIVPHDRRDGTVDVCLLFGGFDLMPLLEGSLDAFEKHFETSVDGPSDGDPYLEPSDYRQIRTNLREYIGHEL